MDKPQFTKLSSLVNDTFTVEKAYGYQFKLWDNEAKRMLVSETYEKGYRKIYSLDTDKGKLDLGAGQLGNLLEVCYKNGESNINGKTFEVKSNGKTGMDIRYYLNLAKEQKPVSRVAEVFPTAGGSEDIPFDMSEIPF